MGAEDLVRLGDAAYWAGSLEMSLGAMERAYVAFRAGGDDCSAALVALSLRLDYTTKPALATATGWLRRAERLLEGQPECLAHGYLAGVYAVQAIARGDLDRALAETERMIELGARLPDRDLHVLGLQRQGQVLVARGAVVRGLELLDEVVVAAMSGELGINAIAVVYCSAIATCRDLGDYGRAGEWSDAAKRWCEREASRGFPGLCRVYHGEIVRRRGGWQQAEQEVRLACDELREFGVRAMAGAGAYELGEICRLRGDLASAERAYREASECGCDPQPGLALLRLVQGDVEVAVAMISAALADREPREELEELAAWHESRDRLSRARLLPSQIGIALAHGDLVLARAASHELDAIAAEYRSGAFEAEAACARASLALAEGDLPRALAAARSGRLLWQQLEMPYEVACARMTLGAIARAASDADTARLQLTAALEGFRQLGAKGEASRVQEQLHALSRDGGGRDDQLLTARELEILRLVAEGLTDTEIAVRLFLSPHTIHRHLANVRTKLGQPSRAAAVAQVTRLGLL
ncbi:MAG: LuxR C-terminal-related transcriptional regulator [Solirubrobacteraceae bacterium]